MRENAYLGCLAYVPSKDAVTLEFTLSFKLRVEGNGTVDPLDVHKAAVANAAESVSQVYGFILGTDRMMDPSAREASINTFKDGMLSGNLPVGASIKYVSLVDSIVVEAGA